MPLKRRTRSDKTWFESTVIKSAFGCWLWPGRLMNKGYGETSFRGKHMLIHRIAWILWHGEIPNGLWVLHDCDTRQCCNPEHLFLGTAKDNTDDMMSKGRNKANRPNLTHARAIFSTQGTQSAIARQFGVTQQVVSNIKARKSYGWITQDL